MTARSEAAKPGWVRLPLGVNPIIVKELRSRMRGVRAFATLTGILLFMAAASYILYQLALASTRYSGLPISPQIGQALFTGLVFLDLLLVCAVTPAVTAGAISGEQEKLTYEMLMATPLRPASILSGKLVSALSYVFLLVFAAVPMSSLVFIFGGVSPRDMVKALVLLIVLAVMFGVIGLFYSALFGRTGRATVVSYLTVGLLLFGPLFAAMATSILLQTQPPRWLLVPSPISALFSTISSVANNPYGNPLYYVFGGLFLGIDMPVSQTSIPRPLYHYSLPFYGLLTLVLYMITMRLVQPARRWRIGWKNLAAALLILLLFSAAVGFAFWSTADRYEGAGLFSATPTPFMDLPGVVPAPAIIEPAVPVDAPTPTPNPGPVDGEPVGLQPNNRLVQDAAGIRGY